MLTTVNVTCTAHDQNGAALAGATVTARLTGTDIDTASGSYVIPESIAAVVDDSGVAVLPLWPNELGATQTRYHFTIENPDTDRITKIVATIPNADCHLNLVADLPPFVGKTEGQMLFDAAIATVAPAIAAKDDAVAARDSALGARDAALAAEADAAASAQAAAAAAAQTDADAGATAADRTQTGLDKIATAADRIATGADKAGTAADAAQTAADRVQTGQDKTATAADRSQTGQDRTATAADRVATGQDKTATAADRVQTGQDKTATAADRVQTGLDRAATAADRVQTGQDRTATGQDKTATAADRVQTGLDRVQTGQDKVATAADRVQTGLDRVQTGQDKVATAADRVQTGLDRTAADTSATSAIANANLASTANTNAQTALAGTTSAATQAANARDAAIAASQVATAGNESLAAISKSIHSGSIVKAFLYDTSKDSDAGAWRKRTSATSWYNENINGAWLGQAANELAARGDNLAIYPEGPASGLTVSNVTDATLPIQGYAGSFQFGDNSVGRYVRPNFSATSGVVYGFSFIIQMDDGSAPSVSGNTTSGDLCAVLGNAVVPAANITVTQVASGVPVYRVTGYATASSTSSACGVQKYTGQSTKGFRVTALKFNLVGAQSSTYSASPELVTNGGFDNGTVGWSATANGSLSIVNGEMCITSTAAGYAEATQTINCVVGKVYALNGSARRGNTGSSVLLVIQGVGSAATSATVVSTLSYTFVATATTHQLKLQIPTAAASGETAYFDNISVKEVTVLATPYVPYSALSGSYYQNTTDGKYYSLNSTYGQTEVFRGNSREFPALAAIVAESGRVIVYDLTQVGCPMAFVFAYGAGGYTSGNVMINSTGLSSLAAINGKVLIGDGNALDGRIITVDFVADTIASQQSAIAFTGVYAGNIAQRNASKGYRLNLGATIVNKVVNDIACTVLPDSAIDPATGLPVPTIAVATAGGISVIKQDGTVANLTGTYGTTLQPILSNGVQWVDIRGGTLLCGVNHTSSPADIAAAFSLPSLAFVSAYGGTFSNLASRGCLKSSSEYAFGSFSTTTGADRLTIVKDNPASPAKSMAAVISTAFSTGYQIGDARLTALADVTPEVITASGELISNGSFAQDTTGWSQANGANAMSVVSGQLNIGRGATNRDDAYQTINVTTGKQYTLTYNAISNLASGVSSGATSALGDLVQPAVRVNGAVTHTFVATSSQITIAFWAQGFSTTGIVDNISVKEVAGVELVTNGTFNTDITGVTAYNFGATTVSTAWDASGALSVTSTGADPAGAYMLITTVPGKQYTASVTSKTASTAHRLRANDALMSATIAESVDATVPTTHTVTFTARSTQTTIYMRHSVQGTIVWDNVSVRDAQNLVLNGTFDVDTSNWTAANGVALSVVAGAMRLTASTASPFAYQEVATVVGRTYQATGQITAVNAGSKNIFFNIKTAGGAALTTQSMSNAVGTFTMTFVAPTTTARIEFSGSSLFVSGDTFDVDNIKLTDITELVTNGQFEGMTTGWAQGTAFPSLASCVNGELQVTSLVGFGRQMMSIPTIVGKTYVLSGSARMISGSGGVYITQCTSTGGSDIAATGPTTATTATPHSINFTATATTSYIAVSLGQANAVGGFDNVSVRLAEADRSVRANGLIVNGSLTKAAAASGSQLVAYSGFSASNYLEQPYSASHDYGTGDFCVMGWGYAGATGNTLLFSRGSSGAPTIHLQINTNTLNVTAFIGATGLTGFPGSVNASCSTNAYHLIAMVRRSGVLELWIDGVMAASAANTTNVTNTTALLRMGGLDIGGNTYSNPITLVRASATAPSADQIAKIYRDELALFQPGAQCTIAGTSAAVTALAYDEDADLLHVGTSWGRTAFQGLKRVASEATAVGSITSLAAGMGSYLTAGTSGRYYQPALTLRDELRRQAAARQALGKVPVFFPVSAIAAQTAFVVAKGYTVKAVYSAGLLKTAGTTGDRYSVTYDGFQETVTFLVAPGAGVDVQLMCVRA